MNIELKMSDNVTKPMLYAYPIRLVKVGYDYKLYHFKKFISLCKIGSSYSYTLILVQRGWVIIHYYQTCVISYLVHI